MLFDIVIPSYNNKEELLLCLKSLENQTLKQFRVLVCIDGSTDSSFELINSQDWNYPTIILKHSDNVNRGRPAARNLALPFLSAPYVFFLDSDLQADPNLLLEHYNFLKNCICVSVGEVIYTDTGSNHWAAYMSKRGKGKFVYKEEIPFMYFNTQNVALPTKCFVELNGFDEKITRYGGDDTEFAFRLYQKYGMQTVFNSKAKVSGIMNKSLEKALLQMEEFGGNSLPYIVHKHPNFNFIFSYNVLKLSFLGFFCSIIKQLGIYRMLYNLVNLLPTKYTMTLIHVLVATQIAIGLKNKTSR